MIEPTKIRLLAAFVFFFAAGSLLGVADTAGADGALINPAWRIPVVVFLLTLVLVIAFALARAMTTLVKKVAIETAEICRAAVTLDAISTAQRNLDANIDLLRRMLYARGAPEIVDGKLFFGDFEVNGDNSIVDHVESVHGGSATIFAGATRVATNIKDAEGKRQIGTSLARGPVYDAVFNRGETYCGEADIFGKSYITIYEPLLSGATVIGIIFVATVKSEALSVALGSNADEAHSLRKAASNLASLRTAIANTARLTTEANNERCRMMDARRAAEALAVKEAAVQRHVVESLSKALDRLARADLTSAIDVAFPQRYEKLKQDFATAQQALQQTMQTIASKSRAMGAGTAEIAKAINNLSLRTQQQAANLAQTAVSLDDVTSNVRQTADGIDDVQRIIAGTATKATQSGEAVVAAVEAMGAIETSSNQISQIINVMDEIALQTNLLALNAGVEAARAGDAGKGFAVVAMEVRALAQRSADAAKEIKHLISDAGHHVRIGVQTVGRSGDLLGEIVSQFESVNSIVSAIALSAQQQAKTLQELNSSVGAMENVTQQNTVMVEECTASTENLAEEASRLHKLVGAFKIDPRSKSEGSKATDARRQAA